MKPMKFPESCKYMRDLGGVVCWMGNKQDLTFIIRRIKVTVWGVSAGIGCCSPVMRASSFVVRVLMLIFGLPRAADTFKRCN